ncbi:aldehyde oxidase GLOX-like [Silene latifolia]|uniref:aldehyde oxidase GLOX-like n=1 Tax=Silene latifolia TaxID=37657 RepID=UPI003D77368F
MSRFIFTLVFFLLIVPRDTLSQGGQWQILQKSIGISAMHMQLLNNDRVIIFDRTDFGPSNLTLPSSAQCHPGVHNTTDCTGHSVEYNVLNNTFRPLNIITDTWCSSGNTLSDGRLLQSGGNGAGDHVFRMFSPCPTCDWNELSDRLFQRRWYATNHILNDGRTIIIGGIDQFNYEFFPKTQLFQLPFLSQTRTSPQVQNNLYPYVFLNVDGNLFIFANNRAILFDYNKNNVVRTYPVIPGGDPRNYPSTGSAVLLPFSGSDLEFLVCGGTPANSFLLALKKSQFLPALNTCARIKINDPNPTWVMETMPMSRTMGDMLVLPNGKVLIINGARSGAAGWELGREPVLSPVIYNPGGALGSRFNVSTPSTIPRMYHSSAVLLRDGRVLVGGSNPHQYYNFTNVLFPTELSLEAFSPPYLDPTNSEHRPYIREPVANTKITYNKTLVVNISIRGRPNLGSIKITMVRPAFNTHSFSMSQRLLVLTQTKPIVRMGHGSFQVEVSTPGSANHAPPGFYMLFAVHQDIPSVGVWVQIL